jgi:flagellar L-ring protein precursor FlgH
VNTKAFVCGVVACGWLAACAKVPHIKGYQPKHRTYAKDGYASPDAARSPGSLWSDGAHHLFEETRGRRVGDILTVFIDERADATRDRGTALARQSGMSVGVSAFLNAMQQLAIAHPGLDPNVLISGSGAGSFNSQGQVAASGQLSATLPVRIKEVLPNGDFFLEGSKMLLLNNEESTLYISGVTRPIDVGTDNSVSSSVLADVELEYTGRGVLADNDHQGWLSRLFGRFWPF